MREPGTERLKPTSFRHTKAAQTTSFEWLHGLTKVTAYEWFKEVRFADNGGAAFCPYCGSTKVYDIRTRPRWWVCAAAGCRKQFSATSGTIFHSRKLDFLRLVKLVFHFADCAKGAPALELSLKYQTSVKTAWVNMMKMRQAMSARRDGVMLQDVVEMDAVWIGGKARKKNMVKDDEKRRAANGAKTSQERTEALHESGKRAVMVVRQRDGESVMFATDYETGDVAKAAVDELTLPGTLVVTDQAPAYASVGDVRLHETVNHEVGYKVHGFSTNWAEGEFSRIRRAHYGIHHRFSVTYLDMYAGEMSWREDRRRLGNLQQATEILTMCLKHPESRELKGYWQHYLLPDDQLDRPEMRWARVHDRVAPRPAARKTAKRNERAPVADVDGTLVVAREAEPFTGARLSDARREGGD
jgi:hypothetical protein